MDCHNCLAIAFDPEREKDPAMWRPWILLLLLHLPSAVHPRRMAYPAFRGEAMVFTKRGDHNYKSSYTRYAEVRDRCSVLPHANPNPNPSGDDVKFKKWSIANELPFFHGDWWQQAGAAPLMPFISWKNRGDLGMPLPFEEEGEKDPLSLASLWITDIDLLQLGGHRRYKPGQHVNVSAILELGMSSARTFLYMSSGLEGFQMGPGFSLLTLHMEGVYTELPNGERRLCLLGCTSIPLRGKNASNPWDFNRLDISPDLRHDCQIMADIRFPTHLSLSNRAVKGTLTSLDHPGSNGYFDPIELGSQLGTNSNYEFESACTVDPTPLSADHLVYQGEKFCTVFMEMVASNQGMTVLPNWKCPSSLPEAECIRLGPFVDDVLNGTQLLLQDVRCVDLDREDGRANMSAVLRAVLPSQSTVMAIERTGLDNLTLAMEGQWSKASGQLCMIGCTNSHSHSSSCNARITMYIPLRLSLKQRGVLLGTISSRLNGNSFYPLSFQMPLQLANPPMELMKNMSYNFTKMKEARASRERDETIGFQKRIKKSLLNYPSLSSNAAAKQGYNGLAEDISFHSPLIIPSPDAKRDPWWMRRFIDFDIFAVEDCFIFGWMYDSRVYDSVVVENSSNCKPAEQKEVLRVAGLVKIRDEDATNSLLDLSVEGEYIPAVGMMYLMGCREVQAPWKVLNETSKLLEDGLDCMLSMRVQFPPLNLRWFMNPTAKLNITSKRREGDPLYFSTMELETIPIMYRGQLEEMLSRVSLEGVLSIVTLSLMVACIVSQLMYIGRRIESTPYISHIALAILVVGYSLPLLTRAKSLFGIESNAIFNDEERGAYTTTTFVINALSLAAFLLTLRMAQKVYKSRIRMVTSQTLENWKVPNDKIVFCICSGIHLLGFAAVFLVHIIWMRNHPRNSSPYIGWRLSHHRVQWDWERELRQYFGLIQDLFLLPQVVGNLIWKSGQGKAALRKFFYMGITTLRLLPHIYDRLWPPAFSPFFSNVYQYANPKLDFYSKAGDIAISALAVLLAIAVYIQQERWNRVEYWGKVLINWGSSRLLIRTGFKKYESLPCETLESEMVESESQLEDAKEEEHATLD